MNTTTRKNPFATLADASTFQTKVPRAQPVTSEAIERIAENRNFPSREVPKSTAQPARKQRRYRTGRDQHLGIKTTEETRKRFYDAADKRKVPLGELLRLALDALEKSEPNASYE
jgi:hypothetical protein